MLVTRLSLEMSLELSLSIFYNEEHANEPLQKQHRWPPSRSNGPPIRLHLCNNHRRRRRTRKLRHLKGLRNTRLRSPQTSPLLRVLIFNLQLQLRHLDTSQLGRHHDALIQLQQRKRSSRGRESSRSRRPCGRETRHGRAGRRRGRWSRRRV